MLENIGEQAILFGKTKSCFLNSLIYSQKIELTLVQRLNRQ